METVKDPQLQFLLDFSPEFWRSCSGEAEPTLSMTPRTENILNCSHLSPKYLFLFFISVSDTTSSVPQTQLLHHPCPLLYPCPPQASNYQRYRCSLPTVFRIYPVFQILTLPILVMTIILFSDHCNISQLFFCLSTYPHPLHSFSTLR